VVLYIGIRRQQVVARRKDYYLPRLNTVNTYGDYLSFLGLCFGGKFFYIFHGGEFMPSSKILAEKQQAVADLAEKLKTAAAGVLVNYSGITVEDDTKLRAALRNAGVEYKVMKNTLTGRACEMVGYGDMKQYLEGMTALAISVDDPIAPAKILKEYAEKVESFEIKAGFIDGGVIDANAVNELASIPAKEVLIAKMLGCFQSSISKFVYVLDTIAKAKESN
jgi:large subunit ribosomal protein L10